MKLHIRKPDGWNFHWHKGNTCCNRKVKNPEALITGGEYMERRALFTESVGEVGADTLGGQVCQPCAWQYLEWLREQS